MNHRSCLNAGYKIGEWQALEGLSTVSFQQKQYDRSLAYLNAALDAVSADSSVTSSEARQRIIRKLNAIISQNILQQQTLVHTAHNALEFHRTQNFHEHLPVVPQLVSKNKPNNCYSILLN